jgi:hypothetical protein
VRLYPHRWFDFVRQTLQKDKGGAPWQDLYLDAGCAARLVEFCVRLNKTDVARATTERLVEGSLRLVESLPLSEPRWKNEI